jgi:FkbM family methyltransferase
LYFNYKNIFERKEIDFVKRNVKSRQVVLDIGANIGFYTLLLSDLVGKKGKVYAFEPEKNNFQHLKGLCGKRTNVTLINSAVGEKRGVINLYVSENLNVDHHTFINGETRKSLTVKCDSIDKYFGVRKRVDFVKIDTQGFEYKVLLGMKDTLLSSKNIVLVCEVVPEALKSTGASVGKMLGLLKNWGFKVKDIKGSPLTNGDENRIKKKYFTNIIASRK